MSRPSAPFLLAFRRRIVLPVVSVIVVGFTLAALLLYHLASVEDREELHRSLHFTQRSIELRTQALSRTLMDYAAWGAAYTNLHVKVDTDWAYKQENVGASLFASFKYDYVFVVAPDGKVAYLVREGQLADPSHLPPFRGGLESLLDRARAAKPDTPIAQAGLLDDGGIPVLTAAAILSNGSDPTVPLQPGPPSVLVFGQRLTDAELGRMGEEWFVPQLRLAKGPADAAEEPNLALTSADGHLPYVLRWTPQLTGRAMLWLVFPCLALTALALAGFVVLVVRHAAQAASTISAGESRLADAQQQMQHLALHDATTGLPNRSSLSRHLAEHLPPRRRRVVLLYIDLDRFKPINDSLGHGAGDFVLAAVANRLRRSVRDSGFVARLGGDEFVIALHDISDDDIEKLCQRLLRELAAPIAYEDSELSVGASIGVAMAPDDALTAAELLRVADLALNQAKRDGRGTYRYYAPEMNERIATRRLLEADLRRAVQRGEFVLHYQPRFDTRSLRILTAEALIRWNHPERGLVSPADFIPLAEETGLIAPIGEWVLRTACATAVPWQGIVVSVNVSPTQIRAGDLVATVERILKETGLPPGRLELELTEGVLLEDTTRARETLTGFKRLGVRLAMDDFGTGYSSLGNLRTFPFDAIKIDKQFVADMVETKGARAIVQSILGLGKALGMSVTAEGVETAEQLMLLRIDACDEVQGFYTSPPIEPAALAELLAAQARAPSGEVRRDAPPAPLPVGREAGARG